MIRFVAIVSCALLLGACETAPIQVDSARAVVTQNETTKAHIKTFTDTNRKTQVHIKKVQEHSQKVKEEAIEEAKALETAKKYLDELLGEP